MSKKVELARLHEDQVLHRVSTFDVLITPAIKQIPDKDSLELVLCQKHWNDYWNHKSIDEFRMYPFKDTKTFVAKMFGMKFRIDKRKHCSVVNLLRK